MQRRSFIAALGMLLGGGALGALVGGGPPGRTPGTQTATGPDPDIEPLRKTEGEWRKLLSEAEYRVLREEATERP
ncbi:MAG: peptide-methionine (R)-S-oxide reductase, partial [Gemmatimonadota bacterium]